MAHSDPWSTTLANVVASADFSIPPVGVHVPAAIGGILFLLTSLTACQKCWQKKEKGDAGKAESSLAVAGFMVCSSMMLISNKIAVQTLPAPGTVLAVQLAFAGLAMRIAGLLGIVEVEPLSLHRVAAFGVTPLAFVLTLAANIKILQYTNVETFIMVRNTTPIATSVLEWVFLGRELPNLRSSAALATTLLGAMGYMVADSHFEIKGYSWAVVWLAIFIFDQVYIKHVVNTVEMTTWSRVYYQNAMAALPCIVHAIVFENAPYNLVTGFSSPGPVGPCMLIVSAVLGTAMSYFSFFSRKVLSATAFTVVGNTCKVVSIIVNVLIWDKHASTPGLVALAVCIFGSANYRQAPMRDRKDASTGKAPV